MNRVQILHRAVAAGNIAVVFSGLGLGGPVGISLNVILLLFIVVLLRIKFWVDDEQYIDDVKAGRLPGGMPYYFGIGVAVLSWLVWYLVAFFLKQIPLSSLLMVVVISLSTVWIVAAMVRRGAYAEQVPWLFFNSFYILGFLLIYMRDRTWNPFAARAEKFTTFVLVGLAVVFLFDLVATRILEQRRTIQNANA